MSRAASPRPRRVTPTPATAGPDDQPRIVTPQAGDAPGPSPRNGSVGVVGQPDPDGRRTVEVVVDGWRFEFLVEDAERAALRERATRARDHAGTGGGPVEIRAIIPGRVAAVAVAAGDAVVTGQPLLVVEAMKMQNELRAPRGGTVQRVAVEAGATIDIGDLLLVLS